MPAGLFNIKRHTFESRPILYLLLREVDRLFYLFFLHNWIIYRDGLNRTKSPATYVYKKYKKKYNLKKLLVF